MRPNFDFTPYRRSTVGFDRLFNLLEAGAREEDGYPPFDIQRIDDDNFRVTIAVAGPAWTARAGSGDVLAGICGALLASGLPAWKAGVVGASIQAITAMRHPGPYTPDELSARMPQVIAELTSGL